MFTKVEKKEEVFEKVKKGSMRQQIRASTATAEGYEYISIRLGSPVRAGAGACTEFLLSPLFLSGLEQKRRLQAR